MHIRMFNYLVVFSFTNLCFATDCFDTAISQSAMNICAYEQLKASNKKMEALFAKLKVSSNHNRKYLVQIDDARRKWIAFRDAQVKLMYPGINKEDGSVVPMCMNIFANDLTEQAVKLMDNTINTAEGDVCAVRLPN
jgi:uncharacterized protein YecT (DUF1311 family)